jgi:hypothetical protein
MGRIERGEGGGVGDVRAHVRVHARVRIYDGIAHLRRRVRVPTAARQHALPQPPQPCLLSLLTPRLPARRRSRRRRRRRAARVVAVDSDHPARHVPAELRVEVGAAATAGDAPGPGRKGAGPEELGAVFVEEGHQRRARRRGPARGAARGAESGVPVDGASRRAQRSGCRLGAGCRRGGCGRGSGRACRRRGSSGSACRLLRVWVQWLWEKQHISNFE